MNVYAGIALGRITENAPFCCTRFKGSEDNNSFLLVGPFDPSPATEHTLISDVPEEIVSSIPDLETAARKMAFTLSYPITTSKAHRKAFEAMDRYCHDHCTAFLSA
ncbi:hypothetical protein CPB86DRAFT_784617 [Serendipita vermifera]|nr:hypothetical protein CPB86DRAFT_784617 [Serendipita vermifera]